MATDQAVKARIERNQALVEAMLLAASADGTISERELETLLRRAIERPEFEGMKPSELNTLIENAAIKLAQSQNLDVVMRSLRERLPTHNLRLLAFGLAAAVALADRKPASLELSLLKSLQAALGISEEEVARVFELVERGASLAEALGEPIERLFAEVMVLVSAADGKLTDAEASAMVRSLVSDPVFRGVSSERAQTFVSEAVRALQAQGLPERLTALAQGLTTHKQRKDAYRLAARIASANGPAKRPESRILEMLQATFGLADDEAQRIRDEA